MAVARYAAPARWLHWLTAAVILAIVASGFWMNRMAPPGVLRDRLFLLHESLGVTLFGIAVVRVWVRWTYPPPPLPGAMPMAMRLVARGAHLAMYLLLLGLPVLGYVATNAHGFTLRYFGVISLPVAVGKDAALAPVLSYLHFLGTMSLLGLIGLHLMAVGFHSLVLRDGLGRRMA